MPTAQEPIKIVVRVQCSGRGYTIRKSFNKRPSNKQVAEIVNDVFKEVYR